MMKTVNPTTGELIREYEEFDDAAISTTLDAAVAASGRWRDVGVAERAACLQRLAEVLTQNVEVIAALITEEMGKPLREARAEVLKSAGCCTYYAETAEAALSPKVVDIAEGVGRVKFKPMGVILALMPWNYPVWQVVRAAAPIMAGGNVVVLKHAETVTGSALLLAEMFAKADFPTGGFQTVVVPGRRASALIDDPRIAGVTLTGSEDVGRIVASACAPLFKKSVLELGGSDPFVVLSGADARKAADVAVKARFQNAGQSCIAAKRMIVVEEHVQEFTDRFIELAATIRIGDPTDEATDMGPMSRADLRAELHAQVVRSVELGATIRLGGVVPDGPGAFYPPTVLVDIPSDSPVLIEETFGPVAPIVVAKDNEDAIRLANLSAYGLSSAIWSSDPAELSWASDHIEAGGVFANGMTASDPKLPFGGVKNSGWGRELGTFGIKEFVNIQTYVEKPVAS